MKKSFLHITACTIIFLLGACSEEAIDENSFGTLTGKVVAKGDNSPLVNAKITSSPVSTTVFTDASGNFRIDDIQAGEYSVQTELAEFQTAFQAVDILEGKTVSAVFELDSVNVDNLAPKIPLLVSPEEGIETIVNETEFTWGSSANDDDDITYTLELRNGDTNEIEEFLSIKDTTIRVESLVLGKNYFWQVTADDGINPPVKSALGGFATKGGATNRFFFVREIDGNYVIFSGSAAIGDSEEEVNQNNVQLTGTGMNSYRPKKNATVNKLAFLRSVGGETHLFSENFDGSGLQQITEGVPVAGFRQGELEFTWYDAGAKLYYPNFNKLYSINSDGSGNVLAYQVGEGTFISEIAVNPTNDLVAIKTNNAAGYMARIVVVDVVAGIEVAVVIEEEPGALGGLDFSIDGTKILYTRDISGAENSEYRQLDTRIFEYELATDTAIEVETDKISGTNNLDAKYSPNDGAIIFTNTSNDGMSSKNIFSVATTGNSQNIGLQFTDAFMPNWE